MKVHDFHILMQQFIFMKVHVFLILVQQFILVSFCHVYSNGSIVLANLMLHFAVILFTRKFYNLPNLIVMNSQVSAILPCIRIIITNLYSNYFNVILNLWGKFIEEL